MSKPAVAGINVSLVVRARMAAASMNGWSRAVSWFYNCTDGMWSTIMAPSGNPKLKPYGNGVLLWFEIEDFDAAVARAKVLDRLSLD
jgi:hypothetical protein